MCWRVARNLVKYWHELSQMSRQFNRCFAQCFIGSLPFLWKLWLFLLSIHSSCNVICIRNKATLLMGPILGPLAGLANARPGHRANRIENSAQFWRPRQRQQPSRTRIPKSDHRKQRPATRRPRIELSKSLGAFNLQVVGLRHSHSKTWPKPELNECNSTQV